LKINVIDLFAGPGGLGEGFFSFKNGDASYPFRGICSVEMDLHAHSTLTLRAFYRKVTEINLDIPKEYYLYTNGEASEPCNEGTRHLWDEAKKETINLELGKDKLRDIEIFTKLKVLHKDNLEKQPTLLIGGPPCQAYSLVGRARNKGKKNYVAEEDHRHFLYKEYLKIMELFSPEIFIMENVKGMLSSQVNGGEVFNQIITDLETCGDGYTLFSLKTGNRFIKGKSNPRDFILASEDYGIPQCRHRVIILGIKNTFCTKDTIENLKPQTKVPVKLAISNLPAIRSIFSNRSQFYRKNTIENWKSNLKDNISEMLLVEPEISLKVATELKSQLKLISKSSLNNECDSIYRYGNIETDYEAFVFDSPDKKITFHKARPHMDSDFLRYFFCSVYRKITDTNPNASDFPKFLAPAHKNWNSGKFIDRFKVQGANAPSSTITSHISKDGHYFIHPDPKQCRSLTVREAARLQSFPDSYIFMGKRTNQFHQVGNAVPPLLARKIATVVFNLLSHIE
jgi:DNA (cytosine-5)-methyltransferase 1